MVSSNNVIDVDEKTFQTSVLGASDEKLVLVDFWASWCGPCRSLTPVLEKLADEYQGKILLAKVNTDDQRGLAEKFAIRSLPTVKLFRNGEVIDEFMGAQPESLVRRLIDSYALRDSDMLITEAKNQLAAGNLTEAIDILRGSLSSDPENYRIHPILMECLLDNDNVDEANAVFASVPVGQQTDVVYTALKARLNFVELAKKTPNLEVLEKKLEQNPDQLETLYQLGIRKTLVGKFAEALDLFLKVMRSDRSFQEDAGRKAMLSIFEILGNDPLVKQYRILMSSLLH